MRVYGWCHNGYHNLPATEVVRRAASRSSMR